eukprot:CAMPEP_0116555860 /NCGR_PEP_ID=MMETSP0397-20121206/8378_1 /TAXON_ID=216820 /ORGANISM="Cyclophora tenuis, Strain ECT3854" /LENGTH=132 /DNA_ID=CAMNT_0004081171 /DNA_START=69 /DNA_END=467 /DNA_ORIENTATION=-
MSRLTDMENKLEAYHEIYGPATEHWIIEAFGVRQEDSVLGNELMKQLCSMADATVHSCYVECGSEKNRAFFEAYGFEVVGTEKLTAKTTNDSDSDSDNGDDNGNNGESESSPPIEDRSALTVYFMVRAPLSS